MKCVGNWTEKVHQLTVKPTHRPAWIYGPFPSPIMEADNYENILAIASGIGVTPAVSLAVTLGKSRRVNVIWMVRDPEIIEFYLRQRFYDDNAWTIIFYTGKKPLVITDCNLLGSMVIICKGRPNLRQVVSDIIYNIEYGVPLPESLIARAVVANFEMFHKDEVDKCRDDVARALHIYTPQELFSECAKESKRLHYKTLSHLPDELCTRDGIEEVFQRQVWRPRELLNPDDYFQKAFEKLQLEEDVIHRDQFEMLLTLLRGATQFLSRARSDSAAQRRLMKHTSDQIQRLQRRNTALAVIQKSKKIPDNPFESACRGDKQGRADIARWCAVYCGASKPVINIVEKIGRDSGMHTDVESFNW